MNTTKAYHEYLDTHAAVRGTDLRDYFFEHVKPSAVKRDFYDVHRDLLAFKKVIYRTGNPAIANLVIPVGAIVYAPACAWFTSRNLTMDRKMRADCAHVHSIVSRNTREKVARAVSYHRRGFHYNPGEQVHPEFPFSFKRASCQSGIHFFLNMRDAVSY